MLFESKPFFVSVKTGNCTIKCVEKDIKKVMDASKKAEFAVLVSLKPFSCIEQLAFAAEQAAGSSRQKLSSYKNPSIEFIARATACRQAERALRAVEIKKGKNSCAIIVCSESKSRAEKITEEIEKEIKFKEEKNAMKKNLKKNKNFLKKFYSVEKREMDSMKFFGKERALCNCIIERVALFGFRE